MYFWTTAAGGEDDATAAQQNGPKLEKSGSYESFHAHDDIATVAIFAPDAARRPLSRKSPRVTDKVGPSLCPALVCPAECYDHCECSCAQVASASESMVRLGLRSKFSKEEAAEAAVAGEAAVASAKAFGQVLLTAGYDGEIKVFENLAPPHWL